MMWKFQGRAENKLKAFSNQLDLLQQNDFISSIKT